MCLTNIPEGILQVLFQSDRDGTYCQHAWQQPDCWEVIFAGDMGAQATKFSFFNKRVQKFNTGQIYHIATMWEKAPASPAIDELQSGSIIRIRCKVNCNSERKVAGAFVPLTIPCVIPTLFMKWEIRDDNSTETAEHPSDNENVGTEPTSFGNDRHRHSSSFNLSPASCTRSKTDSPSLQGLKFAQSLDIESPFKFMIMTPQHAEQSTDMSLLTYWNAELYGRKNVWKMKDAKNIQTSGCCTEVCGGLLSEPHQRLLRGSNLTSFVRALELFNVTTIHTTTNCTLLSQ
jgi:hypothetical protein